MHGVAEHIYDKYPRQLIFRILFVDGVSYPAALYPVLKRRTVDPGYLLYLRKHNSVGQEEAPVQKLLPVGIFRRVFRYDGTGVYVGADLEIHSVHSNRLFTDMIISHGRVIVKPGGSLFLQFVNKKDVRM